MNRQEFQRNKEWCYDPQPVNITLDGTNGLLMHMVKGKEERFDVLQVK